jgi:hypothetical protein
MHRRYGICIFTSLLLLHQLHSYVWCVAYANPTALLKIREIYFHVVELVSAKSPNWFALCQQCLQICDTFLIAMVLIFFTYKHLQFAYSPIGLNLIYCARRYKFSVRDCLTGKVEPTCVRRFYSKSYAHERLVDAELLREITCLCEGSLSFVDGPFFLTHGELRDIIAYITSC